MSNLPDEYLGEKHPEWIAYEKRRAERRTGELKKIQADAEQISQLTADPRWEFYGRYLEVRKKAADVSIKVLGDKLLRGYLTRDEYADLHCRLAEQRGLCNGLQFALTIAQVLITQGEKAVTELNLLTNSTEGNKDVTK